MVSISLAILAVTALCSTAADDSKQTLSCSQNIKDEDREKFLDYHNKARRRVAKGEEPNKDGNKMNGARNMHKLEWSCSLEEKVQKEIDNCPTSPKTWSGLGQNAIRWNIPIGVIEPSLLIEASLEQWWNAGKQFGVRSENRYDNAGLYNFANMIFSNTTEVGCSYKACSDGTTLSCLYNAAGFHDYEPMWETGKACVKNTDCTVFPKSTCDDGLCIKGGDIIETNKICPDNVGMPDSVRNTVLNLHNKYRSSLARGKEADPLVNFAPKAKYMYKLSYDCHVEASAMENAKKCVYAHSTLQDRYGYGENIGALSWLKYDKHKAAIEVINSWWAELKQFGVGNDLTYNAKLYSRPGVQIGHYTQMAWGNTYKLGCAVEHCKTMTYVVCQYAPSGNAINQKIYFVGEPCKDDKGCLPGSTCSVSEGLCVIR